MSKKYLLIMRHAKTEPFHNKGDFYRPLSPDGRVQPECIARELNRLNIHVDQLLISPSIRTKETCELLINKLKAYPKPVIVDELYQASFDVLEILNDHWVSSKNLLVIAHCPFVIEALEFLSGEYHSFHPADLAILTPRTDDALLTNPKSFTFEQMISAEVS